MRMVRGTLAVIRCRAGWALISTSTDAGRSWRPVRNSKYPMAAARPYAGVLSAGQRYPG